MDYKTTYIQYSETTRGNETRSEGLIYQDKGDGSCLSVIMLFTKVQQNLMDVTRELRDVTDQIYSYRESPGSVACTKDTLPTLMAMLMDHRERARRQYKDILATKYSEHHWDLENIVKELEAELSRTDELLSLYPHRGTLR